MLAVSRQGMGVAMFQYYMVQISPNISVNKHGPIGAAATYLGGIVDQYATQGWAFYSIESFGVIENAGCGCLTFFLTLLGGKLANGIKLM